MGTKVEGFNTKVLGAEPGANNLSQLALLTPTLRATLRILKHRGYHLENMAIFQANMPTRIAIAISSIIVKYNTPDSGW